ncbi:VOC family protein [Paracoccus jeotgali]|uniref:VOC family protein n=1 Tax=Paracoccus jeotgali TaxID=2065379 RepID=A0A2K9MGX3_9RHOB|nr:VOC family protein [Paracoccus jeotgali]AUM74873.1 VOC family protein [Paracoccus jeotgali]
MQNTQGMPIWYELMTKDPGAVQDFYHRVMGWTFEPMPDAPGGDYHVASIDGTSVAGLMQMQDSPQAMWFVYLGVQDVDASAAKVQALGGRVEQAPTDIPGVGRFAFCADPQGAYFYLMRGDSDQRSEAFATATPGHCSWNELITSDQRAALSFYGQLLGWEKGDAMPMGEAGDYTFLMLDGQMIGAVMDSPDPDAAPYWNFAFQVPEIDAAAEAVRAAGGVVRMGPTDLPDGQMWLVQITDPQGAELMLTGPRKASQSS